jgi:hypothetical protein
MGMIYIDYVIKKSAYLTKREKLTRLLEEKEKSFSRTQPGAIRYDKLKIVQSVDTGSTLEEYVSAAERLGLQIVAAAAELEEAKAELKRQLGRLIRSKDTTDRVFVQLFVKARSVEKAAQMLDMSAAAVYYHQRKIRAELEKPQYLVFFL